MSLERLYELARRDAPAPLPAAEGERMIARALATPAPRRSPRFALVAVAALAASFALAVPARQAPSSPVQLVLPGGDRVLGGPDARVELVGERQLAVRRGAALFDVAPGRGGFAVTTADARVEVRGTVFSVDVDGRGTRVRVYEGRVAVQARGREVVLDAGEAWGSAGPPDGEDPLRAPALAAAAARAPLVVPLAVPMLSALTDAGPSVPIPPPVAEAVEPDEAELRRLIGAGRADEALAAARRAAGPRFRLVEADALRALGRFREAAEAYLVAAAKLPADQAARAGYLAAYVYLGELDAARSALAALDTTAADAPGSPLEERALLLRARALDKLGDPGACAVAATYLERFPTATRAGLPGCGR